MLKPCLIKKNRNNFFLIKIFSMIYFYPFNEIFRLEKLVLKNLEIYKI